MSDDVEKLLREAMLLPAEARAAIAGKLIESLDTEVDDDAEEAWGREVGERIADAEAGRSKLVSWPEARRKILGKK
jgi:hypothetical protein